MARFAHFRLHALRYFTQGHADALLAEQRVISITHGLNAVKRESRLATLDNDIAMCQPNFLRAIRALHTAK